MNNILRYGDLLILYQPGAKDSGKENEGDKATRFGAAGGVLSSLGFADKNLYMQELPKSALTGHMKLNSDLNMVGLRDCVFSITPKLNYDFHYEYKQTLVYYKSLETSMQNYKKPSSDDAHQLFKIIKAKLKKLETRMKKEEQQNHNLIRENAGKPVLFGSEIQIMHYDSKGFIKATNNCLTSEAIGYKCELNNFFSSGMIFKVTSRYRSRQEGDSIQLRDNIIITSVRHNAFLTPFKSLAPGEKMKQQEEMNPFLVTNNIYDPRVSRFQVFFSQEIESSFQVVLYRPYEASSSNYILGGDLVRVTHTEIQADLCSSISHIPNTFPEVYFRSYDGEYKEEATSLHSYWIIEHMLFEYSGDRFRIGTNETIENRSSTRVRLRNFVTGGVLGKSTLPNGIESELVSINNLEDVKNFSSLDLEPIVRNHGYLVNSQIYFISEAESTDYLKYDRDARIDLDIDLLMTELKNRAPEYPFYPLNNTDIGEVKYCTKLNKEFSSEDAYIVQKVNDTDKRDLFFVRSTLPIFKKLRTLFSSKNFDKTDPEHFNSLIATLKQVIVFLFDMDSVSSIDFFEIEEMPSPKKQKLLKDIGFLDALIGIIYLPFASRLYNISQIKLQDPFGRMLELSYTTLRYAIKEYRPNELYASQWIHMIIDQSLKTNAENDIRAGQTLTELIDNNQRILESRIELKTILEFVNVLKEGDKDAKYVEILRAICICDGMPMIKNQKDITREMLSKKEVKSQLIFGIENNAVSGIMVELDISGFEKLPLIELEKVSKHIDDGKTFNYVISIIRLLSDLCMDRNYLAIDIMQKEFTYDICYEIISNPMYNLVVREAFAVFMVNLWIDVSPLQAIDLPQKIKVWDNSTEIDQAKSKENHFVMKHENLKSFIFNHLQTAAKTTAVEDEQIDDHFSFDLAILKLTE
jgi:hypothetical protein